jgi:hypothetical protein
MTKVISQYPVITPRVKRRVMLLTHSLNWIAILPYSQFHLLKEGISYVLLVQTLLFKMCARIFDLHTSYVAARIP